MRLLWCSVTRGDCSCTLPRVVPPPTEGPPTHGKESHLVKDCSHLWFRIRLFFNPESPRMEIMTTYYLKYLRFSSWNLLVRFFKKIFNRIKVYVVWNNHPLSNHPNNTFYVCALYLQSTVYEHISCPTWWSRKLLVSSHFGDKETGVGKNESFCCVVCLINITEHLLCFRHCPGYYGYYHGRDMVPVLEEPTFW